MPGMESPPRESPSADERWTWPATGIPLAAWAVGAVAAVALVLGAVIRGFIGTEWYWDASLLVDALPAALPFVLGAAILAGAFRWPASRAWLVAGATLFVVRGLILVARDAWFASWMNGAGSPPGDVEQTLMVAGFALAELAFIGGMAAMATALWRFAPSGRRIEGWRRAGLAIVALVGALGIVGVGVYVNTVIQSDIPRPPIEIAYWLLLAGTALAAIAVATATVLAIPDGHRLPEITIATGALVWLASTGGINWSIALPPEPGLEAIVLIFARGVVVGLVVMAAGFALARLFPARTP